MSSTQDQQYDKLQASWLASHRDGSFKTGGLANGGSSQGPFHLGSIGGPSHGPCYSEFDQFNRSSMMFPRPMNSAETVEYVLRIVAQADHEMLLRSGNEAYANALSSHNGTKAELASLQRSFELLVQNRVAPNQADEEHHHRPSGLAKRLPYRKADCPNINYWTRKNYDSARLQNAPVVILDAAVETKGLPFMEHEDGTPLTEEEAVKMRATARGIFAHFLQEGTAPAKWGQVSVVGQDFFFNAIAERHPHAAMCEDMWKIQLLATTCYPSWHRNNREKIERKRQELIWMQQQLEHGRQVKEELIENVEHVEGRLKRDRAVCDANDMPPPKPSKKAKTTYSRVGSSLNGMASAPPRVSVQLNGASQHTPTPAPLPVSWPPSGSLNGSPMHTHGQDVIVSAPSTISGPPPSSNSASQGVLISNPLTLLGPISFSHDQGMATPVRPSASFKSADQREPTLSPSVFSGPLATLSSSRTSNMTLDSSISYDTALDGSSLCKTALNMSSMYDVALPPDVTSEEAIPFSAVSSLADSYAPQETQASSAEALVFDEAVPHDMQANPSSSPLSDLLGMEAFPFLPVSLQPDANTQRETQESTYSDAPLDADAQLGTQANIFLAAPAPGDSYETAPSTFCSPPESLSERQVASPGAEEATAETLLSLRHEEPSTRPRPSPRNHPVPTGSQDFYVTFDMNNRKTASSVRNPLGDLMQTPIPTSNLMSSIPDPSDPMKGQTQSALEIRADKENEGLQPKGRGRPAGKPDGNQQIKPTKVSATPRNLFAQEYKDQNGRYATEAMWQSMGKEDLKRFDDLSKEKKAKKAAEKLGN